MPRRYAKLTVTIAALVGLSVSSFLLAQYTLPPSLGVCPINGGCHVVRSCRLGSIPLGPMPVAGILGFLLALVLSLSNRGWVRRILPYYAALIGVAGVGLLVLQKTLCGAFCIYCVLVDVTAVVLAVAAWMGRSEAAQISWKRRLASTGIVLAAIAGIALWRTQWATRPVLAVHIDELPPAVAREQRPGKAAIVMFLSTTCPHCRAQHAVLTEVKATYGDKVRLIPKFPFRDPKDEESSRAILCAAQQDRGEAMLHELYGAPFWPDLSRANCDSLAVKLGLDDPSYKSCLDAPETVAALAADGASIAEASLSWVPTTYVGHDRFDGNAAADAVKASLERALREASESRQ